MGLTFATILIVLLAYRQVECNRSPDKPVAALIHRFRSAPGNWITAPPISLQTLFLTKVFIIFPHEPASFESLVWKNVLAVGLKKEIQFADILLFDRFAKTGVSVVDTVYDALPTRLRPKNIHCIGVGFGAKLCALLGKRLLESHGEVLGRLTACDPMGQIEVDLLRDHFDMQVPVDHEFVSVASFVDVVHTSFLGTKELLGDVDVFVNSAIVQPECLPLNLATEIINICQERQLRCPPIEDLHSCASGTKCPKGLINELDETIRSAPFYADHDTRYADDLYKLFRPSQERAALLFAASLQPYLNCPVCKPNLKTSMCACDEGVLAKDYAKCPTSCDKPESFGLRLKANTTGTFHVTTSGWWPYFSCVTDDELHSGKPADSKPAETKRTEPEDEEIEQHSKLF